MYRATEYVIIGAEVPPVIRHRAINGSLTSVGMNRTQTESVCSCVFFVPVPGQYYGSERTR